jgi:hypothetical protein
VLWRQLPYPECPQAHFVNVHQGCPHCGTAIFRYGGFYPWKRSHLPCDFRSTCPSCGTVYPSNDIMAEDFISGETPDDGFGYFDADGHIYLFTATYHRDQVMRFDAGMQFLTARLRTGPFEAPIARQLAVMLLRYAVDILYVAAVPQFRYGPSLGVEQPWTWGQSDWADEPDPVAALSAKGMRRYCIDVPYISETLALAYDTVWPVIRNDAETVDRAQALGISVERPEEIVRLIEEMLAAQLQCIMDRGARTNLPRESMGALVLLRALDRPDAQDAMDWLYDQGPDRLRVFGTNDFLPDGCPPEATGGYNNIHTAGLFALEYHLRHLRAQQPDAYPASRYPSLVDDPRAPRVARQPHEVTMIGRSWFQYGDGSAPGSLAQLGQKARAGASLALTGPVVVPGLDMQTLVRAAAFTDDPIVKDILEAAGQARPRRIGTTVHDGVGIAILRTGEVPERAALGVVYGDTTSHRHMDLLDVQLFAFDRPFLTDLGYPQSWASIHKWEAHWATHNTVWGVVPGVDPRRIAGRGRLVRTLFIDGLQVLDIAADRWALDAEQARWYKPGVSFRRLLALVETDDRGVAVIDLCRIHGGTEHWRVCRGLQGTFAADDLTFTSRPGTVASPEGARGDTDHLAFPDYEGLACMDDVQTAQPSSSWRGAWQSTVESGVWLDLYQVYASNATEILTARATAVMGTPEESAYAFRTLLWRRHPADARDATCVDLVLEPHVGPATLAEVNAIPVSSGASTGIGVSLVTRQGKRITLYWAPESDHTAETLFTDGTALQGPLAAVIDGRIAAVGVTRIRRGGRTRKMAAPATGTIAALSRQDRTIDIEGITRLKAGDRLRINPDGRGHHYAVESVEPAGKGRLRLTLDVTSLLGRATVLEVNGHTVELGTTVMARTGNLNRTRLLVDATDAWTPIVEAFNPEPGRTTLRVEEAGRLGALSPGDRVSVVDYVVGDTLRFEPTIVTGGSKTPRLK